MDNLESTLESGQGQEGALTLSSKKQCAGIEIVRSADVSRRLYSGPRPVRRSAPIESELSTRDRVALLLAQIRLLRLRAEMGVFVSPDSIARAERLASSLETAA
jgi:hypothetical protein